MNKKPGMSVVLLMALMLVSMANAVTNWRPAANGIVPPDVGNWNVASNWNNGLPVLVGDSSTYGTHTKAVLNAGAGTAECQVTDVQGKTTLQPLRVCGKD